MAGRISDRDIAAIRERVRIEEVVGDYVQLRRAGADSLKGLCPFHNEKSPSFHVRPNHGHFHCFGCGEGGDVYAFIQKIEHVSFVEAVELLADRVGHTISYTGAVTSVQRDRGSRSRLIAANAAAAEFYAAALESDEAAPARQYLTERNFDAEAARHFGCGFAPSGWEKLTKHLQRKGFEFKELEAAGLSREGRRGPMDRFHRRLLWPIRTASGEVIGFGARRLFDDDPMEAKYVNTPETLLYKKSSVMFGIDLAKRDIAKGHQAVVVEGYTDVMAMHLAGVTTAVASCGTAFGDEHLAMLRRLMMDDNCYRGELIFVFDGDAAGRAAALKAFDGDQHVAGKSFVAVAADGMDPCDLRLNVRRQCAARPGGAANPDVRIRDPQFDSRGNGSRRRSAGASGRAAPLRSAGGPNQGPYAARRIRPPPRRLGRLVGRGAGDRTASGRRRAGAAPRTAGNVALPAVEQSPAQRPVASSPQSRACPSRPARPDPVAAARGAQVGVAVPGVGRPGVRHADRRELHPPRIRGRARGHRRGGRHVDRRHRRGSGSTRCASRPRRR